MAFWRRKEPDVILGEKTFPPGTSDEVIAEFKAEVARELAERGVDPGIVTWDDD